MHAPSIEASEALAQRRKGADLGDQTIEAVVSTDLDALCRHHDTQTFGGCPRRVRPCGCHLVGLRPLVCSHAPSHQHVGVPPPVQFRVDSYRRRDAVDDDAHDAIGEAEILDQALDGRRPGNVGRLVRLADACRHPALLAGGRPLREDRVRRDQRRVAREGLAVGSDGCGRHLHNLIGPRQRATGAGLPEGVQCLDQGRAEMHFVEQDEGIGAGQAGVDRPHPRADSVPAEEQSRSELVDRGDHDGRLAGPSQPFTSF